MRGRPDGEVRGFWVDNRERLSGMCGGPRKSYDTFSDFHEQDVVAVMTDRKSVMTFVILILLSTASATASRF